MFARVKKSGKYQYLQLVENRKEKGRVKQQVIATLGRMDELSAKGRVETLIRSLWRFSEQALLIISGKSDVALVAKNVWPALIFERLWRQTGIGEAIDKQAAERKFEFDVERAVFLTVLHRLMVSGSDRFCNRWHQDYVISGVAGIEPICCEMWPGNTADVKSLLPIVESIRQRCVSIMAGALGRPSSGMRKMTLLWMWFPPNDGSEISSLPCVP